MRRSWLFLTFLYFSLFQTIRAQTDTVVQTIKADTLIQIAADTLSSDLQEGGLSVEALAFYNQGLEFYQSNQLDSAILSFTNALMVEDSFPKALLNRAGAYLQVPDYQKAIDDLDLYISQVDTATNAYFFKARSHENLGNIDSALVSYNIAASKDAFAEQSHLSRAEILIRRGEIAEAKVDLDAALVLNPNNSIGFHDRASCKKLLDDLLGAAEDYGEAIRVDPKMTIAYVNLGGILRKQSKLDEALAEYNQAVRLNPNHILALNNRGYTYFLLEELDKAEADFRKVIQLDPDYAYAHNNLAGVLIKQEKYKEAIESASSAISLNANYGFAYLNRGIAREMVRDVKGACSDWSTAQEMGIQNADVYQNGTCQYR